MSSDLVAFLRARLDEDEQVARVASGGTGRLDWVADGMQVRDEMGDLRVKWSWPQEIAHIARWDPARVLAEVEAKRAILDHHRPGTFTDVSLGIRDQAVCVVCHGVMGEPDGWDEAEEWGFPFVQYRFPCPTLRLLALPHAAHPEFNPAWRPA